MKSRRALSLTLIAMSWLGMLICLFYAVAIQESASVLDGARWLVCAPASCAAGAGMALTSAAWTPAARLALWLALILRLGTLWQLRLIGTQLLMPGDIPLALERPLRRLGAALLLTGAAALLFPAPEVVRLEGMALIARQGPGFVGAFATAIGVIGVFALAGSLGESARLREENAGFV